MSLNYYSTVQYNTSAALTNFRLRNSLSALVRQSLALTHKAEATLRTQTTTTSSTTGIGEGKGKGNDVLHIEEYDCDDDYDVHNQNYHNLYLILNIHHRYNQYLTQIEND